MEQYSKPKHFLNSTKGVYGLTWYALCGLDLWSPGLTTS